MIEIKKKKLSAFNRWTDQTSSINSRMLSPISPRFRSDSWALWTRRVLPATIPKEQWTRSASYPSLPILPSPNTQLKHRATSLLMIRLSLKKYICERAQYELMQLVTNHINLSYMRNIAPDPLLHEFMWLWFDIELPKTDGSFIFDMLINSNASFILRSIWRNTLHVITNISLIDINMHRSIITRVHVYI